MAGRFALRLSTLLAATVALAAAGYPLAGVAAVLLDVEGRTVSIGFRAAVCLLSLLTVAGALAAKLPFSVPRLMAAFLLLYGARLLWDVSVGVPKAEDAALFLVATGLIPALAAMTAASVWDDARAAAAFFWVGALTLALILFVQTTGYGAWRSMTETTGRLSFDNLNPITVGHLAVSTLAASLCRFERLRLPHQRLALAAGAGLALVSLVLSASRGPLLAGTAVVALYLHLRGRWRWMLAAAVGGGVLTALNLEALARTFRMTDLASDLSTLERLTLQRNAIEEFLEHPLTGSAYAELVTLGYPHNLLIEAAMALGVAGLGLAAWLCLRGGWIATRRAPGKPLLLSLLFVQFLVAVQFSGAIWNSGAFWVTAALLFGEHARRTALAGRPARRTAFRLRAAA